MATGSTYPGTLDAYVDKLAGDFLTVADVNNRSSAIEKLEAGPLRLNDATVAAPAYAFRSSASTGLFYVPATPSLGFAIGGVPVAVFIKSGSAVNYVTLTAQPTGGAPSVIASGTDTNVGLALDTKGTGPITFLVGSVAKMSLDTSGRLLVGHTQATSAGSNDVVLKNVSWLRSTTSAGTDTVPLISMDASNRLLLGGTTTADIVWSKALVSMGGGATATMGSIGGTGPATATQNTWMRVVDSTNAAFWVPAWK